MVWGKDRRKFKDRRNLRMGEHTLYKNYWERIIAGGHIRTVWD
jgi:hypothetical protein